MQRSALSPILLALLVSALAACGGGSGGSEAEQIAAAKVSIEKRDLRTAAIQLKSAIQKSPNSAEARFLLGQTLLAGGDATTAVVELTKALELKLPEERVVPELARAMLMARDESKMVMQFGNTALSNPVAQADLKTSIATAYALKGNMSKARELSDEALRLKDGFAPALIVQARIKASDGDVDGALVLLDKVLAAEPGQEQAGTLKGEYLTVGKRDPDAALAVYRKVLEVHPNAVVTRAALANTLFQQRKLAEARTEFAEVKKQAPNSPETILFEAQLAFVDGNIKSTRELTERLLKVYPDNVRILELAGAAELRDKNYLKAESLLGHAQNLAPQALRPRLLLAQTYLRSGQSEKVISLLKPVADSPQADPTTLSLIGEAYLETGDNKASEEAFRRATKAAPEDKGVRTAAAIAQLARGDATPTAMAELEAVAKGDPGPRADLALISARMRQNDLDGVLKSIDALQRKLPNQPMPDLLRGRVMMLKKDKPAAIRSFEAALGKDPVYFPAVASLAALDLADGKPQDAKKRFEALQKAQPTNYQPRLALAELEARAGASAATVENMLKEAVRLNPTAATAHLAYVNRLLSNNHAKAALGAAQEAAAALPGSMEIMDALGRAQMAAGDPRLAVATFKKMVSLQPRNPMVQVRLGEALRGNQDIAGATAAFTEALKMDPDLMLARSGLVVLALNNQKPQVALDLARELQKRNPKDLAGYQLEGEIEASRKNWDGAIASFRNALQRGRTTELTVKLHAALTGAGKTQDAEKLANDWVKEFPKDTTFAFYLADLEMARADYPAAEKRYRSVLEAQPNNALAMNNIAWLLAKQGKPGAVAMAEKANALLPDRAPLLDTLSIALEGEKDLAKAIEAQVRAARLEPGDPALGLRLGKLYLKTGDKVRARAELEPLAKLGDKFAGQAEVAALLKSL